MDSVKTQFANSISYYKSNAKNTSGIVLIQMVKDYEFAIKLSAASKIISEAQNLSVHYYDVDWMKWIGWGSRYKKLHNLIFTPYLKKIYQNLGGNIIFSCEQKYYDQNFINKQLLYYKKNIKKPDEILNVRFENISIGDLIYDTYLRYFHQPTIEELNENVFSVFEIALNIFYAFLLFLKSNNVRALINTYSSYVEHGITARICLAQDIPVYTVGSYSYIIQKLEKKFPFHQINHSLFTSEKKISIEQFELAKQKFTSRFEGKIDTATNYMRSSAFATIPINPELKKLFALRPRNIIIYVHDFYDSPHVNRMLQFADLYEYLKQTLEAIKEIQGTTVFIKTHPNGIEGCKEKTVELVKSFNRNCFHVLDESISNLNIIELKPDLIATARGTVCLEMAYFEIPTVALYDNLYANFDFTHTCSEKETYFKILNGEIKPNVDFNKEKIISFYYQAFLEKIAQTETNVFTDLASFKGNTYNNEYLAFLLMGNYEKSKNTVLEYFDNAIKNLKWNVN